MMPPRYKLVAHPGAVESMWSPIDPADWATVACAFYEATRADVLYSSRAWPLHYTVVQVPS